MTGFVANTLVDTENGLVPIKGLKVGDTVLTKDESGEGELSYQSVMRTIVTENVSLHYIAFKYLIDPELPLMEQMAIRNNLNDFESKTFLTTANHPFWVVDKGWVPADQLTTDDLVIDHKGNKFSIVPSGFDGRVLGNIYKTDKPNIGFMPSYRDMSEPEPEGDFVDLTSGEIIDELGDYYQPVLDKLYKPFADSRKGILTQLGEDPADDSVELYGFRQGEWLDPDTVVWDEGEGVATTTVYNIEVADTHTYFVGEAGIWAGGL